MANIINQDSGQLIILPGTNPSKQKNGTLHDSHCHFYNLWQKVDEDYEKLAEFLTEARSSNIRYLVSSALSPEEYQWHIVNKFEDTLLAMGIHPIYKESERDFQVLTGWIESGKASAVGEIGLDKNGGTLAEQEALLLQQLDLARACDLPVIFHVVKRYNELYKLLKKNFPKVRGYLHSYNSSKAIAEHFSQFDLAFSISSRFPKSEALRYIIQRGFMLLETDSPFALAPHKKEDFNQPAFLIDNLSLLAEISSYEKEIIIDVQARTFREIFDINDEDEG